MNGVDKECSPNQKYRITSLIRLSAPVAKEPLPTQVRQVRKMLKTVMNQMFNFGLQRSPVRLKRSKPAVISRNKPDLIGK